MWILIDLQNLVAIIMEHKMVALEGDLQWQQARKAVCHVLGLSCSSCTCGFPHCQTKTHGTPRGCCRSGFEGDRRCWDLIKRTPCFIQMLN